MAGGRLLLRMEPSLHGRLKDEARAAGESLNAYCLRRLERVGEVITGEAGPVVQRAAAVAGEALVGVVVFGSWARGEAGPSSDVDVLVVLKAGAAVTRAAYRDWDQESLEWAGHAVEPHFVRLPSAEGSVTGLWAEVALDGIVVFDPTLALSRVLGGVRRRILAGEIMRRSAGGQAYWTAA
jgi:hypothetical protein